jgi:hypothetical protein
MTEMKAIPRPDYRAAISWTTIYPTIFYRMDMYWTTIYGTAAELPFEAQPFLSFITYMTSIYAALDLHGT